MVMPVDHMTPWGNKRIEELKQHFEQMSKEKLIEVLCNRVKNAYADAEYHVITYQIEYRLVYSSIIEE